MAKPVTKAEISSFVKGIITEASPLNFPGDASRDEENFKLNRDGTRERRLGMDFETDYTIRSTGYTADEVEIVGRSSYEWIAANDDPNNEFIVVQFGNKLTVFDATKPNVTSDGYIGSITVPVTNAQNNFSYASVDGYLVVVTGDGNIYTVTWDGSTLSIETSRISVRDVWGYVGADGNEINERSKVLTSEHIYNLRNQGWGIPRKNGSLVTADPIAIFAAGRPLYPSNAESVINALQFKAGDPPAEVMYPSLLDESLGLDNIPPKGYFIIDLLNRSTSRLEAILANAVKFPTLVYAVTSLPEDYTTGGCTIATEYAGRVFYSGFNGSLVGGGANSPILSSYIAFSQLVKSKSDITKCYQSGDPTSREGSDVVDTDGGFIRISGIKKIVKLVPLGNILVIFGDNGVWSLAGGSDYGFTATNYMVNKLSSYGCINGDSVVVENDKLYYWGDSGIFALYKDQFGDYKVDNISEPTIQSLYDEISSTDKEAAVGIYDPLDKKIRWLYNIDANRANSNDVYELVLDTSLGAFYKNRIYSTGVGSPDILSFVRTASFITGSSEEEVIVGADTVEVNGVEVVLETSTRNPGIQSIKYICLYDTIGGDVGFTFSQYHNTEFRDWKESNGVGVDAKAFLMTGSATAGDSSIAKQIPYLVMHFIRTESGVETVAGELVPRNQSSCLCRSQWDWANSINSNKWGELFQAYRYRRPYLIANASDSFDTGFETVVSKSKIRGRGKSFSLYMETEPYKDCRIVGWSLSITGNSLA